MSSLEINKIVGSVLLAGVIAMSAGFVSSLLTHPQELDEPVYLVAGVAGVAGGAGEAVAAVPTGPEPVLPLLAAADSAAGEKVAKKCTACHTFEEGGANKIGPNLYDVVGRQVAAGDGFAYSGALQERAGDAWTFENLNAFLAKPKDWAPGTKMSFAGLKKVEDRAAMIAYMRDFSASPLPLPSPEEIAEAAPAPEATEEMAEEAAGGGGLAEMVQQAVESAGEAMEEAADEAGAAMQDAAEGAAATVQDAAEAASETMQQAADSASEAMQGAGESTAAATQQAAADANANADGGGGLATQVAVADPGLAKKVSRKCTACHTFKEGGKNKIGPNLYNVIGRGVAGLEGFNYSDALIAKAGETWTYENLIAYLTKPKAWAPGTKMTFAGLRKETERAAIIAFMRTYHDDPPAVPE